ncbi:MAG: hypothetical protein ACOC1F_05115 [Myxococcota bacterium]
MSAPPHQPSPPFGEVADDQAALDRADAKKYLWSGAGVAAIGAVGAVVGGAVCPVCVVATPALVGFGLYKAWRGRER